MKGKVERWGFVAVLVCAAVAACGSDDKPKVTAESAAGISGATSGADADRPDPAAIAEQAILRQLADRDEALLEIARVAASRREQLQVSTEARRILADRRRESNRLLGMLKGEYRVTHRPRISEQDQLLVDSAKGSGGGEFDKIFLGVVAKHHEDDVRLIDEALPSIKHPRVRETLTAIRAQRVGEATDFRKRLSVPSGS